MSEIPDDPERGLSEAIDAQIEVVRQTIDDRVQSAVISDGGHVKLINDAERLCDLVTDYMKLSGAWKR